jgi:hypothetical protein
LVKAIVTERVGMRPPSDGLPNLLLSTEPEAARARSASVDTPRLFWAVRSRSGRLRPGINAIDPPLLRLLVRVVKA